MKNNPFLFWIKRRIDRNKNVIIVINGPTGGGKSYSALSIGESVAKMFGTPFSVEGNVAFKFPKLLEKMQRPDNQKPGSVFIFEEVGSFGGGASSREWQSKSNKFFFSFMQTSRHRNQILIMTCPMFSNLESGARSLTHMKIETLAINPRRKCAYLKPQIIQANTTTGKLYFKYLRYKMDGLTYKFNKLVTPHPSKVVTAAYETEKLRFTEALNQEIIDGDKKKTLPFRPGKIDRGIVKILLDQGLKTREIAERLKTSVNTIVTCKKDIKKGKIS